MTLNLWSSFLGHISLGNAGGSALGLFACYANTKPTAPSLSFSRMGAGGLGDIGWAQIMKHLWNQNDFISCCFWNAWNNFVRSLLSCLPALSPLQALLKQSPAGLPRSSAGFRRAHPPGSPERLVHPGNLFHNASVLITLVERKGGWGGVFSNPSDLQGIWWLFIIT